MKTIFINIFLCCLILFSACGPETKSEQQITKETQDEIYLPITYLKPLQVKTITPSSNGQPVNVTLYLYSLLNNGKDSIYVWSENSSQITKISGYNFFKTKNQRRHYSGKKDWFMSIDESGFNPRSEYDSTCLPPGKTFVSVFDSENADDIDSLSFDLQIKTKRGGTFKDTLLRKRFTKLKNERMIEAKGNW